MIDSFNYNNYSSICNIFTNITFTDFKKDDIKTVKKFVKYLESNFIFDFSYLDIYKFLSKKNNYKIEDFDNINQNDPYALKNKGNCLLDMKKYGDALIYYNKVIKLLPNYGIAYYNKGLCLSNMGKFEEAIVCYDKALKLEPNSF